MVDTLKIYLLEREVSYAPPQWKFGHYGRVYPNRFGFGASVRLACFQKTDFQNRQRGQLNIYCFPGRYNQPVPAPLTS